LRERKREKKEAEKKTNKIKEGYIFFNSEKT
jgi:hypothetical protein